MGERPGRGTSDLEARVTLIVPARTAAAKEKAEAEQLRAQADQSRAKAEGDAQALRAKLLEQFNMILATRDSARGLIDAVPSVAAPHRSRDIVLRGLLKRNELPKGCRFAPRCDFADEACFEQGQVLLSVAAAHAVACRRVEHVERLTSGQSSASDEPSTPIRICPSSSFNSTRSTCHGVLIPRICS